MRTAWLYCGNQVLTAVRVEDDASDAEVIRKAIESEERVPLAHLNFDMMAPFELKARLRRAEVRYF